MTDGPDTRNEGAGCGGVRLDAQQAEAAREVVRYAWADELRDYLENDEVPPRYHIFRCLVHLRDVLGLHDELEGDLERGAEPGLEAMARLDTRHDAPGLGF